MCAAFSVDQIYLHVYDGIFDIVDFLEEQIILHSC